MSQEDTNCFPSLGQVTLYSSRVSLLQKGDWLSDGWEGEYVQGDNRTEEEYSLSLKHEMDVREQWRHEPFRTLKS